MLGIDHVHKRIDDLESEIKSLKASQEEGFSSLRQAIGRFDFSRPEAVARQIAEAIAFKGDQANDLYRAFVGTEQHVCTVPQKIPFTSSLCHQVHFGYDPYRFW